MTAPTVIASGTVGWQCATEVGRAEGRDRLFDAELDGCRIKCVHSGAQFSQEIGLRAQLIAVRVIPADCDKEELALHSQVSARGDEF